MDARGHRAIADRNEALADRLVATDPEWAVTILFYAAVHHIGSFFALNRILDPTSHETRRKQMVQHFGLPLRKMYQRLYQKSRDARYDGWRATAADYDQLKRNVYQPLKAHILSVVRVP